MKNPPILISVIGFFAALAGVSYLFFGLSVLGFDWFGALGDLPKYESVGLWGWFAIIAGIAWILVAGGLWALQPWARMVAMIVAGISLFEAVLAMIQFPGRASVSAWRCCRSSSSGISTAARSRQPSARTTGLGDAGV